ncbi:MAG TPA: cyclic nucleotide-binding domain-containing protein [Thermoanaerobaculia bacterium]|nr:cyclic nucleotide-binding domain-containing protein [Thermoanaerobaculia bacterium]
MNTLFQDQWDHPLFRYLAESERQRLEGVAAVIELEDGQTLIREGERDSRLYAVEQGVLEIVAPGDRVIAAVGPGEVLGEVSFIDDSPRSASVRAAAPSILRAWDKRTLLAALGEEPATLARFSVALNQLLVERIRDTAKAGVVRSGS